MKRIFASLALASIASFGLQAQEGGGGYVRATLGYHLGVSGDVLGTSTNVSSTGSTTVSNNVGTAGGGLAFGLAGGYFFNENIGIDLEAYYLLGSKTRASSTTAPNFESYNDIYTRQIRIAPALVLRASGEKIRPYARVGLLLPVGGKTVSEEFEKVTAGTAGYENKKMTEVRGRLSLGFTGAFGAEYSLNEKMSLFAELNYAGVRVNANTAEITEDMRTNSDGSTVNNLENAPTIQREIRFVNEVNSGTNTPGVGQNIDATKPVEILGRNSNFSSLGLRVGIVYGF